MWGVRGDVHYYLLPEFRDFGLCTLKHFRFWFFRCGLGFGGEVARSLRGGVFRYPLLRGLGACFGVMEAFTDFEFAGVDLEPEVGVVGVSLSLFLPTFDFGVEV